MNRLNTTAVMIDGRIASMPADNGETNATLGPPMAS